MACDILQIDGLVIANLLDIPMYRTGELSILGRDPDLWLQSRSAIAAAVTTADSVLFGYGCTQPSGVARYHFRAQTSWVSGLAAGLGLSPVMVGGEPRHPSRWQRWTSRRYPGLDFRAALRLELTGQ